MEKYLFQARHSAQNLYQACEQHGFTFTDNGAARQNDLWNDGIHLLKSQKIIVADNLMHNINHFLQITNQFI